MSLNKKVCPICSSEIGFDFVTPAKSFYFDSHGMLIRDIGSLENPYNDLPSFTFYCRGNNDHIIDTNEILEWCDKVEKFIIENDII